MLRLSQAATRSRRRLIACAPNTDNVLNAARRYLQHQRLGPDQVLKVRLALELAALDERIPRLTDDDVRVLRDTVDAEVAGDDCGALSHGEQLHNLISERTGNLPWRCSAA